jgi:hypothetical protein
MIDLKPVSTPGTSFARRLVFSALAMVLLNLPMILLSKYGSVSRPLLNVDYSIALFWLCLGWRGGLAVVIALTAVDALCGSFSTFFFRSLSEWLSAMHFGGALGVSVIRPYLVAIGLGLAGTLAAWSVVRRLRPGLSWQGVLVACTILMALDWCNGSSLFRRTDHRIVELNVGGSQLIGVGAAISPWTAIPVPVALPADESMLGHLDLPALAQAPSSHGVLVVLVESWGLRVGQKPEQSPVFRVLDSGLVTRYAIETGTVPFRGATTAAELREWCGAKAVYAAVTPQWGQQCHAWIFARAGWQTSAVHGFNSTMFERIRWWPDLGFRTWHFLDIDPPTHGQECGFAFLGLCDADVLADAVRRAAQPRHLVYALTLNAHLPLHESSTPAECQPIGDYAMRNACHIEGIHVDMARKLVALLADGQGPDLVAIVGDHAPPFVDADSRALWNLTRVPFIILRKRGS